MIELPEAAVLARQCNETLTGKTIRKVTAAQNPHKFAWFSGDPASYPGMLEGKTVGAATSHGGMVEIQVQGLILLFGDGVNLHYHSPGEEHPAKHQLLLEFEDATAMSATIAMYGGLWCCLEGTMDSPYYLAAVEKPSPLGDGFSTQYFESLFVPDATRLPLKAFLATQQRIPGLGNGVLQDILYRAGLHPKRKVSTLEDSGKKALYESVVTTLGDMAAGGGRDTEKDLFGNAGGYRTRMSKNTVGQPCPACGSLVQKQAYMGGSIYFCPGCQKEN